MTEEKQKQNESDKSLEPIEITLSCATARVDVAFSRGRLISTLENALGAGFGSSLLDVEKLTDDELVELSVKLIEHIKTKIAVLSARLENDGAALVVYTALVKSKNYAKKLST